MFTKQKINYSWETAYCLIKNKHDEAFKAIDDAITLEEHENKTGAIEKYKEGIRLIDAVLGVQVQCPENPDSTWEKAQSMIRKIKKTRAEILTRIHFIQNSTNTNTMAEYPPTYKEATSPMDSDGPKTYKDLATALEELSIDPIQQLQEEVIYLYENVRVYFISPNGEVLSTQNPETLTISLVKGVEPNVPKAVLQVGTWIYPLVPGVSPCYRTNYGAFILPDLNASAPGYSVGIVLPCDADQEIFDLLENILHGIIGPLQSSEDIKEWKEKRIKDHDEDYSTHISNTIVDKAYLVSRGIISGAEKAGEFFNKTTPTIINNIQPVSQPTNIPPTLTKTIQVAETATNKAAKVTGFIAGHIGAATVRLGRFLAPHIQKGGTKLLLKSFNMPEEEASNKVKNVLTIAAGAVEGFGTIYHGLETSAAILGNTLKENTVKIIEHKYGYPASNVAEDTLSTMGNVYNISQHTKVITPKGLAKRTGKGLVYGYSSNIRENNASYENGQSSLNNSERNSEEDKMCTQEIGEIDVDIKKNNSTS